MAIVEEDLERLRASVVALRRRPAVRRTAPRRPQLGRSVPVPRRAQRVVQRARRDRPLPLLRVRRRRRRVQVRAGDRARRLRHRCRAVWRRKVGIQLRYTTGGEGGDRQRQRRKQLVEAMGRAVDWYHDRLLNHARRPGSSRLPSPAVAWPATRPARFKLGWAPDDWDAMCRDLRLPADVLHDTGLAFTNKAGRLQDSFRARVMFPILTETGDPVAFGGRILPGSSRSGEVQELQRDADLRQVEDALRAELGQGRHRRRGPGDRVRGLHRRDRLPSGRGEAGRGHVRHRAHRGPRAPAEAVRQPRWCWRSTPMPPARVPPSGSTSGRSVTRCRFGVARFPEGKDPGDLSVSNPEALRSAIEHAEPFFGFRLTRGLERAVPCVRPRIGLAWPERRWRSSTNIRTPTCARSMRARWPPMSGLPGERSRGVGGARRESAGDPRRTGEAHRGHGECRVRRHRACSCRRWDDIAEWLVEDLFADDVARRAFLAVASAAGSVEAALEKADPEAREFIERAAVADLDVDPTGRGSQPDRRRGTTTPPVASSRYRRADELRAMRDARLALDRIDDPEGADAARRSC